MSGVSTMGTPAAPVDRPGRPAVERPCTTASRTACCDALERERRAQDRARARGTRIAEEHRGADVGVGRRARERLRLGAEDRREPVRVVEAQPVADERGRDEIDPAAPASAARGAVGVVCARAQEPGTASATVTEERRAHASARPNLASLRRRLTRTFGFAPEQRELAAGRATSSPRRRRMKHE